MGNKLMISLFHSEWDFQNDPLEDYLAHHGIRKQRWGVRNGPPYPLDRKTHSRIVKGKQDKEIKRYGKKKVGISHLGNQKDRRWQQVENFNDVQREFVRDGQLFVRTFGGSDNTNLAALIGRGGDDELAWKSLDRPGHKVTSEDLLDVNMQRRYIGFAAHNDGKYDAGLSNNCGMCSAALFLRGLGYEVQAGRTSSGVKNTAFQYWFDGAKPYKTKGAAALYSQLESFGNQGKGVINVRHKNGSGHAVYFQMEKSQDGKVRPVVYDGQIAKKYSSLSEFLRAEQVDTTQFTEVTRLDGATPNWKHLAEDNVIRANFTDPTRHKVRDTKTGDWWYGGNFSYVDDDFSIANAGYINSSKANKNWTLQNNPNIPNGGIGLRRDGQYEMTDAVREAARNADRDREAREFLKKKYGIGG